MTGSESPGRSTVAKLATLLVRRWRWPAFGAVLGASLALASSVTITPVYRVEATIVPSSALQSDGGLNVPGSLLGAAREFGVSLGDGAADPSSLFPRIIRSRAFAREVLSRSFRGVDGEDRTLLERLAEGGDEGWRREARAVERFQRDVVGTSFHTKSGVTTISVHLSDPVLAVAVAEACIKELDAFNRNARSAQASGRVGFIAQRVQEAEAALLGAEDALQEYRTRNRILGESPELLLEDARLLRTIELCQQVYVTLKTQHELARIEEVKNLPLISVIDPPSRPLRHHVPRRGLMAVAGLLFGWTAGVMLVILRQPAMAD